MLIGFAAFTFLIPAASYFYKRMALGFLGPGLIFGAILFALIIRAIWPRRSNWLAPLAFFVAVVACGEVFMPWWDSSEPNGTLEAVQWLSTHDLPADAKLYCTPNDQLTLTFLTGLPVQSVAPIRKNFIDSYPGRMIVIESSPPYQQLQLDDIVRIAGQSGTKLSWMDAWKLQAPLCTRLQRIELASRCEKVDPPLEPTQSFTDAIVAFQREYTMRRQQHWMDNGANNPVMRGFDIPNFASWWPIFFYRFVDPLSAQRPPSELRRPHPLRPCRCYPQRLGGFRLPANRVTGETSMTMTASKIFPTPPSGQSDDRPIEVSIVLPCLNEADTVGSCVTKAVRAA